MSPATIHDAGVQVVGTYMDVPIAGTVRYSRGHTINWQRFEVTVELDAESAERVAAAGYRCGSSCIVGVAFGGGTLWAAGAGARWETDYLEVAE